MAGTTQATFRVTPLGTGVFDWRERAACRDEDPELFFPIGDAGPAHRQIAVAKFVCDGCPVRANCLEWALEASPVEGVWGGTTDAERAALLDGRARGKRRYFTRGK